MRRQRNAGYSLERVSVYEIAQKLRQHLLTGVSYAIPFIACGGILIAAAIAFAPMTPKGPDFSHSPILQLISNIGSAAFALMLPVLAGYIAYSAAGKPALAPGFIGGYLSGEIKAGFLGALLAGLIAGYLVNLLKKLPVSKHIRPVMPILVIPILSSLAIGLLMLEVLGVPIANLMTAATNMLRAMSTGSSLLLALMLGAMIAFDMGGPVNKTAFFFGAAMIQEGDYRIMGACAAAICIPPLGMGVATLLRGKLWTEEEREAGIAGITDGPDRHHRGRDSFRGVRPGTRDSMHYGRFHDRGGHRHDGRRRRSRAARRTDCVSGGRSSCWRSPSPFSPEWPSPAWPSMSGRASRPRVEARDGEGDRMKIVAVTACATGIAHTYMAAEQLEKTAKALGHQIKVETQGAMGIENELSANDIRQAQAAIFAADIEVEGSERFEGVKLIRVPVQEAIKDPKGVIAKAQV